MNTYGWKKVFKFTFVRTAKTKTFVISSILISIFTFLLTFLVSVLPVMLAGDGKKDGQPLENAAGIKQVYFIDDSGITTPDSYAAVFEKLGIKPENADADAAEELRGKTRATSGMLLISITNDGSRISIFTEYPEDGSVLSSDANVISSMIGSAFSVLRLSALGLDESGIQSALLPVGSYSMIAGEVPENELTQMLKSVVPMMSSLVMFMLIFVFAQLVAQSVAQEKTSKVIELLLTSVRPLAVIIGKVLAIGLLSFIEFMIFAASGGLGLLIAMPIVSGIKSTDALLPEAGQLMMSDIGSLIGEIFKGVTPLTIITVIFVFITGYTFFALIAGLIGASVSRSEELNSAMQPFSILGVLGFYFAYFPAIIGNPSMNMISYFLPISSPFALPAALLTGSIDGIMAVLAILTLVICTCLMAVLVARVYEQVIFHAGTRLKLSDILGIARGGKNGR